MDPAIAQQLYDKGLISKDQLEQIRNPPSAPGTVVASEQVIPAPGERNLLKELQTGQQSNKFAQDAGIAPTYSFDTRNVPANTPEADIQDQTVRANPVVMNVGAKSAATQGASSSKPAGPGHYGVVGEGYGDPFYKPETELEKRVRKAQEERGDLTRAEEKEAASAIEGQTLGAKRAAEQEAFAWEKRVSKMRMQNDYDDAEAKRQAALQDKFNSVNKAIDDLSKMKVDANRFWNNTGTAGQIGGALGVFFGGIGAGINHTPNQALEIIENAINRDIDEQKTNIANKRGEVEAKRGILHDTMALTGDQRQAQLLSQRKALDVVESKAEAEAARYNNADAQNKLQQFKDGINTKREELNFKIMDIEKQKLERERIAAAQAAAARQKEYINKMDGLAKEQRDKVQDLVKEGWDPGEAIKQVNATFSGKADPSVVAPQGDKTTQRKVAEEKAGLEQDLAAFEKSWKMATENLPGGRASDYGGALAQTEAQRKYNSAVADLATTYTTPGERSDKDYVYKVKPLTPLPGEEDTTLRDKKAQGIARILRKYPMAAQGRTVDDFLQSDFDKATAGIPKTRMK
jgi:hypothetical protein